MQSPVTAEPFLDPGGTYNSTRYPPDRIYPRKKTNRKETIPGKKPIGRKHSEEKNKGGT